MDHDVISLSNICGGAVEEIFQREMASVLANVADVNTDPEAKRKLNLEFTFEPFEDRSGAQITFKCNSKLVGADPVKGTMFLQRKGLNMVAIPHDPRQLRFSDVKSSAANDVQ